MKTILITILLFFLSQTTFAQKISLSGKITDPKSETIIGANILLIPQNTGTISNLYGQYTLKIEKGQQEIKVSYIGYAEKIIQLNITKDTILNIELEPSLELPTIEVKASQQKDLRQQFNRVNLSVKELEQIPVLLGEPDIMKSLSILPGISTGVEGSSGLNVRGGTPDQNLILLDGAKLYNANHVFGFLSVINPKAVKYVDVYKGNFPARFGGRLSSVIDVRMRDGNKKEFNWGYDIGLISSKIMAEGPLKVDTTSFLVALRGSYWGFLNGLVDTPSNRKTNFHFYDLNAKINHTFKKGGQLFASYFRGDDFRIIDQDDFSSQIKQNLTWGNEIASLRYFKPITNDLFFTARATGNRFYNEYSIYNEQTLDTLVTIDIQSNLSKVKDATVETQVDKIFNEKHSVQAGVQLSLSNFAPNILTEDYSSGDSVSTKNFNVDTLTNTASLSAFIAYDAQFSDWLQVEIGGRFSRVFTSGTHFDYLEPRVGINFSLKNNQAINLSYTRMHQPLHLLVSNTTGFNNDIWVPATAQIRPEESTQYTLGYGRTFDEGLSFTVEGFYKEMSHLIEYKPGAVFFFNQENGWQDLVENDGTGKVIGLELFVRNQFSDRLEAFLSYTLSKNTRKFSNINDGTPYPARYDRTHDIALSGSYVLSKKWTFSSNWIFSTGHAVTLPTGLYTAIDNNVPTPIYEKRNNARMPHYHRLDAGFNYKNKTKKGNNIKWN